MFIKTIITAVIMILAAEIHAEETNGLSIRGNRQYQSTSCQDFYPHANLCNVCENGGDLPEASSKKAVLGIYNTLENSMTSSKLVLFSDDFKYSITPLAGDELIISDNLFEYPPEISFFTSKSGRPYTFVDPGKKVTIVRAKSGYGIELSKLRKTGRHLSVRLEMKYRFYDSPEYGKLTNERVHRHCIFYYAGKQ